MLDGNGDNHILDSTNSFAAKLHYTDQPQAFVNRQSQATNLKS